MSTKPLWTPSPERVAGSEMQAFSMEAGRRSGQNFGSYAALWQWSVDEREAFWNLVWDDSGVIGDKGASPWLVDGDRMPGARWFPEARLNYAENLLRHCIVWVSVALAKF